MTNSWNTGPFRPHWGLVSYEGPKIMLKRRSVKSELSKKSSKSKWHDL